MNESTWRALLEQDGLIKLAITRERTGPGPPERTLVATAVVDWRKALQLRGSELRIDLRPCGPDSVLSSEAPGVLKLKLDVKPLPGDSATATELAHTFDDIAIKQKMQIFTANLGEAARGFYLYARKWWQDYTAISSRCAARSVRLFARDEAGETRCVCTFVSKLRAGRALDSPRHAARFVALLPMERDGPGSIHSLGGARAETWASPFALVSRRVGDVWEHACLLCSLLLGFGLNAYVAVGTITDGRGSEQEHAWVITCTGGRADPAGGAALRVTAWESISAQRCSLSPYAGDGQPSQRYMSIACVFSHERFYANRQETDRFPGVSFDFTDPKHWKSVDEVEIKKLQAVGATPASDFALTTARLDSAATEAVLEAELRALIKAHRDELGIATTWDEEVSARECTLQYRQRARVTPNNADGPQLCCLLQPALAAYEMEIIVGADIGSDDIHHAIRHQIPEARAAPWRIFESTRAHTQH